MIESLFLIAQLTAGLGAHLEQRQTRGVVDVQLEARKRGCGVHDGAPVAFAELALTQLAQVHAGLGAQNTLDELVGAHLETEQGNSGARLGRIGSQIQRERGFADAGTSGKNKQVAAAQAPEQLIHVGKAGRHACHMVLIVHQVVDFVEGLRQKVGDVLERRRHALLRDVEEHLLGLFDDLVRIVRSVVSKSVDVRGGIHQVAQDARALDDFRVALPIRQSQGVVRKLHQVRLSAHRLELAFGSQTLGQ